MAESKVTIYKALAQAQSQIKTMPKNVQGYGYKYVKLDTILEQVLPILNDLGLFLTQFVNDQGCNTIIYHESGESIESGFMSLPESHGKGLSTAQNVGVSITYIKRYQLSALLGIASDEDTDASAQSTQAGTPAKAAAQETQTRKADFPTDGKVFEQAVQYVAGGGSIDKIKAKYNITQQQINKLTTEAKNVKA